jgi:hypothetical protein
MFDIGGTRSMVAGVVVSAASVVVPVVFGSDADAAKVDLLDGTAWLASESAGNVVRVNAETGRVDARLDLGVLAGDLLVEQGNGTVLVKLDNQVRSIDLANLDWSSAAEATGGLVVGDGAAYMVEPDGLVRELDPATLRTIAEVDLEATPGPAVVAEGRLVLPLSDGTVRVVDGDEVTAEVEAGEPGDALHVTLVGDRIAVLNQSTEKVRQLDPGSGDTSDPTDVELPSGELLVPRELPSGRLWMVATRSGELTGIGLRTGRTVTAPVTDGRHQLTPPVAAEGRVYVVDRTSAEVLAIDAESLEVVRREPLGIADASRVELVVEGGKVFVNDRASSLAIVIDGDEFTRVDKYSDEGVATETPPTDIPNLDPAPGPPAEPTAPQAPPAPPTGPPAAPTAVEAVPGNASATVSWSPGAGPQVATDFHVTFDGGPTIDVPGNQVNAAVDGLTNGDTYTFEVWASNEHGESERVASNEVEPNDEVPGAPSGVQAVDGDASAEVSWTAADGRGNDITGYLVTPSPTTIEPFLAEGTGTSTTVEGLTNDTEYTFTVTAVNELDVQSEPSPPSNPVTPYGPPTQVTGVEKAEGNGTVGLTWGESQSRTPVTYIITANPPIGAPIRNEDLSYEFDGLQNGTTYTFTIIAENDRGTSAPQTVDAMPGTQPTVNNVQANRSGDRSFDVTFDVDNGGRPITGCTVTRSGGGSADCNAAGGSGSVSMDVPTFDTGYTFTVSVTNAMGTGSGEGSGRSAGKPLVVDAEVLRWDGACWPDSRDGQRPYYVSAAHNSCDNPVNGWLNNGAQVRALCQTTGEQIQDDYLNQSNKWVQIDGGWMSTLYFRNFANTQAVIDGLRAC